MRAPLSDGAADVPGGFDLATAAPILPPPPDLRLAPAAAAAWLAAWVAVGTPAAALLAAAPAGCAGLVLLHRRRHLVVAAALLCVVTASGAGALRVFSLGQGPISELARVGAAVTVELVVGSDPRRYPASTRGGPSRSEATLLRARIDRVSARGKTTQIRTPVLVIISGPAGDHWAALVPGHRIRASGVLGPPRAADSVAAVLIARGPPVVTEELGAVYSVGEILRAGLREAVRDLRAEERGLLPGLVVGDVSHLPPALAEDFRATGMTHLITVSGVNVGCTGGTQPCRSKTP